MRRHAVTRVCVILAAFILALRLTAMDGRAQSLGEVAAREAVRRAAIKTPARVYSNVPRTEQVVAVKLVIAAPTVAAAVAPPKRRDSAAIPGPVVSPARTAVAVGAKRPVSVPPTVVVSDRTGAAIPAPPTVAPATPAVASSLAGWSMFQIKKTSAEMAETVRLADVPLSGVRTNPHDLRLPPQHDVLRLSTGVGYLQGADWGGDVAGSGKINGLQTEVNAFVTVGPMGFQARSGRVSMVSPSGTWRGEGGDLYSDLRGLARGGRVSWSVAQKWTPSVSIYLRRRGSASNDATVVGYRDRLQLMPHVQLGGELTSDGAAFLQGRYGHPRLDLTAFYRFTQTPMAGRDKGLSGSVALGRGVAVSGAVRLSDAVGDFSQWQLASMRLPIARQASVTLERSWWTGASDDGSTNAMTLQLALGPVRLIQRLQWGRTDYRQRAVPFGFNRRQSQSTASYTMGRWGSVNYQQATQWFDDGRVQEWDEVSSMLQFGRRTTAQFVTAFPNVSDPRRFRARVTQRLSPTLLFEAQYGRLSAFQMTRVSEDEQSRVMLTIRKTWMIQTPARGGDVRGRAIDQAGNPVAGALVRLGPYSAITDETGDYQFTRVPDGQYDLALDRNKLPAAYAWDEAPRPFTVTRGSREHADMQVIPLSAIRGRVYIDRNQNGRFDTDEGVANAVVALSGSVTATNTTGSYTFYNQPPGRYTIRLDVPRLAKGLAPVSPAAIEIELTAVGPLLGVDFVVEKKDMPIIMRTLPK